MPQYSVNEPLKHDGQAYAPGETVEMDAKAAKPLQALGVLGPVVKAAAKAEAKAPAPAAGADAVGSGENAEAGEGK
jgi:hypothetical protein